MIPLTKWRFCILILAALSYIGCSRAEVQPSVSRDDLNIQANMVFFYYEDLANASDFYEKVLGLNLVLDYGFAKAYRVSQTSYVCLVDEKEGMHDASEPKTVTLAFLTEEPEAWYQYLVAKGVEIRSPLKEPSDSPFRGFVTYNPEGYFLEFETYFDHPQNEKLTRQLETTTAFYPVIEEAEAVSRPKDLGIQGNIIWLYYADLESAREFYESVLGLELLVDEGFDVIFASSPTAFIGLVGPTSGLHQHTSKSALNVGFFTKEVKEWYQYLTDKQIEMHKPLGDLEEGLVHAFVSYDIGGYYLEFDKFLEHERNEELLGILDY